MATSTKAQLLLASSPQIQGGAVLSPISGGGTQTIPGVLYGEGTPAGTLKPWTDMPLGSIWVSTDQTSYCAWVKVQDNDAVADWAYCGGVKADYSKVFNGDNGAGVKDYDCWYWSRAATLLSADLIYGEATDTSGAAEATFALGTAADGGQYVASVNMAVSKALGAVTSLTLASTSVASGSTMFFSHAGYAATEAGTYRIRLSWIDQ
ncbi:MAG: hypothetical protein WC935_00260 [Thermoleophilia bacterium]